MEENERLYPISEEVFNRKILPVIEESYMRNMAIGTWSMTGSRGEAGEGYGRRYC
jgi:hypothetical protein